MNKSVYLDYAATTPIEPRVLEAMLPYLKERFGNPSSIHSFGQEARAAVDEAREQVSQLLNCLPQEIIFTGTTTEADNLAIVGVAKASLSKGNHLVTSPIEHHGALDVFEALEKNGFEVTHLKVDGRGLVDPLEIEKAIKETTTLLNVMYANNEVGTVEPIREIAKIAKKHGVAFHTDAAAAKYLDLDVQKLGVDLMTLGPHKFYGPKGIGILYVRKGTKIESVIKGGMHEYGLRPGTENVPAIVGAAKSLEILEGEKQEDAKRITRLRDRLIAGVLQKIYNAHLTGHRERRVPDIASFVVEGAEGESMLLLLDQEGIAASSGSACTSGLLSPSHVLMAMGISPELAHGSLRFSLGKQTTEEEIDYVLEKLPEIVERLRKMAP